MSLALGLRAPALRLGDVLRQVGDLAHRLADELAPRARGRVRVEAALPPGKVWLVGYGPGDAEQLTRKAERILRGADVLFYDDLVGDLSPYPGRKVYVGKRGGRPSTPQAEIVRLLEAAAGAGERVARVKGGDPAYFARTTEELVHLRARGIPVEIVPGVSAAQAAAAALGVPLTSRGLAQRVELRTARGADGPTPPRPTVVYFMASRQLPAIAAELRADGLPDGAKVAVVERIGAADERVRLTTVGALAGLEADGPATVIAGEVVGLAEVLDE